MLEKALQKSHHMPLNVPKQTIAGAKKDAKGSTDANIAEISTPERQLERDGLEGLEGTPENQEPCTNNDEAAQNSLMNPAGSASDPSDNSPRLSSPSLSLDA